MTTQQRVVFCITLCVTVAITVQAGAQFEQGSTRSLNSTSVSLTGIEGVPGFISATTQRPFVLGLIPVVGDYGGAAAPIYGPASLMPRYNPGPSVVQHRIAQMRQEGIPLVPSRPGVRSKTPEPSDAVRKREDFQRRMAAARDSSAGNAVEGIAAIRRRQQQEDQSRAREIAELSRKMQEAQAAGKSQVARVYGQQIERSIGSSESRRGPQRAPR